MINNCIIGESSGNYQVGVLNKSYASPTISNNIIYGGTYHDLMDLISFGIKNEQFSDPVITGNTIIGGILTLNSGEDISNYGIYNNSSSPLIIDNIISIGSLFNPGAGNAYNYGIGNYNSSVPDIYNNTISGGEAGDNIYGIYSDSSFSKILGNTINGGTGTNSYGILSSNSNDTDLIYNNIMNGGSGSIESNGVKIINCSPSIYNNTINGGTGVSSFGIFIQGQSFAKANPSIKNNIIFTSQSAGNTGYGIYEDNASDSIPSFLQNNNIFNAGSGSWILYHDGSSVDYSDIINGMPGGTSVTGGGNTSGNVSISNTGAQLFVDIDGTDDDVNTMEGNNWHLNNANATICNVVYGGLDISTDFTLDMDDIIRTAILPGGTPCSTSNTGAAGWSMGAYEGN